MIIPRLKLALNFCCFGFCAAALADLNSLLEPVNEPPGPVAVRVSPVESAVLPKSTRELPPIIDQEAIAQRLAMLLQARMNEAGKLRLKFLKAWRPLQPRTDNWHVEILEYPASGFTRSFLLSFKLEVDGQDAGTFQMPVRAELWRDVYFARRAMTTEALVDADELLIRNIDLLELHNPAIPADADLRDYEMTRSVSAGRPLLWRDVKLIPLVREGEVVEAVCEEGMLSITMKAVALESGGRSDFIRIRNPQSHKDIQAEVIDDKKVRVHF
ncbi:MAG: flagellar basal body P-ring formation chaperone FlgA [Opitutales bacterium]